jgi:hypothetical protein
MRIDLLDRPVVDLAGAPIGRVDGVETKLGRDGEPEIATLVVRTRRRRSERLIISWDLVAFVDRSITLIVRKHLLRPS